jgi:hypothetical protein
MQVGLPGVYNRVNIRDLAIYSKGETRYAYISIMHVLTNIIYSHDDLRL